LKSGGRFAIAETTRGCSFDCAYCFRAGFRRSPRAKPLPAVAAELDQLAALGVTYVYLIDETFGLPRPHAEAVMTLLNERGINFGIQTRPDIWQPERVEALGEHGCVYVELGTESLDPDGVAALGKYRTAQRAIDMTTHFRDHIPYVGVNILDVGNPDLKLVPQALADALRDNEGRRPPAFIPYPTTLWGERALDETGASKDWEGVDGLHATYDLASREGIVAASLRRSGRIRRFVHHTILILQRFWRWQNHSRFERGTSLGQRIEARRK
jgi:hypothetical protein